MAETSRLTKINIFLTDTQEPFAIKMTLWEEARRRRTNIFGELELVQLSSLDRVTPQQMYELVNRLARPSPPPTLLQQFKKWWRTEWDEIRKITDSF